MKQVESHAHLSGTYHITSGGMEIFMKQHPNLYQRQRNNIALLTETLSIASQGKYFVNGREIPLKYDQKRLSDAIVIAPAQVQKNRDQITEMITLPANAAPGPFTIETTGEDTFTAARRLSRQGQPSSHKQKVLVLNFANPVHPGGGVRRGARAQEEDLCRQSTLLLSLESSQASFYYALHRKHNDFLASDTMILSPNVEIIRNANGQLLPDGTTDVAVLTCAAPVARHCGFAPTDERLQRILYRRISGILSTAIVYGYRYLVLGAWGCGAFGNDANIVAQLFARAFREIEQNYIHGNTPFGHVCFAVLDRTPDQYNLKSFRHYFHQTASACTSRPDEARQGQSRRTNQIRGCLIGGAAGDALGYPVEFISRSQILNRYGSSGITQYEYDPQQGTAIISDDTQMTLFTAEGLIRSRSKNQAGGADGHNSLCSSIYQAYKDWLLTQTGSMDAKTLKDHDSRLLQVPQLWAWRAPGNTCLDALRQETLGTPEQPINNSKGCGGVMRVAPIALYFDPSVPVEDVDRLGAAAAAITHGHPLGYIPAAALVHMIRRIVFGGCTLGNTLEAITAEMRKTMWDLYPANPYIQRFFQLVDKAVEFSKNTLPDHVNIAALGGGWVAEETFAIALYCSLKYQNDFSKALIVSVNHGGDSDSTGAVTGNILGARIGYEAIPQQWKDRLELEQLIVEMGDMLGEAE